MVYVDSGRCTGCGACVMACPTGAIHLVGGVASVDQERCRECEVCLAACPEGAILETGAQAGMGVKRGPGAGVSIGVRRGMGRGTGRGMGHAAWRMAPSTPPVPEEEITALKDTVAGLRDQLAQTLARLERLRRS